MAKISVIIPIYGVERFIARCAESLFKQTLHDVEYIFVDDATPDNSITILQDVIERYPERKEQIRIIRREQNKGLPAARNTGLGVARGEYIFHCDSDDFVEPDMLECLYKKAKAEDADIVWCDWYLSFAQNERYMKQPEYNTAVDALKGMLGGAMKYNVWNKLAKRSLYTYNHITFPAGYGMGEDMTMMMLFAFANKVLYVPKAFYHYVKTNTEAFSQTYSPRHLKDLRYNVNRIEQFIRLHYGNKLNKELAFFKLEAKFPFLISNGSNGCYSRWREWYPEANTYIMQNRNISLRSRLLQWFASKNMWCVVWIYYYAVMRIIYGIMYK